MTRTLRSTLPWFAILALAVVLLNFPIFWALVTSFKPANETYTTSLIAQNPTLDNYVYAFERFPLLDLARNTFITATVVAVGQVALAVLAAFALVHVAPRRKKLFLVLAAIAMAIPPQTIIIPQFLMASSFGWANTLTGLIVPQLASSALPVLLLVQNLSVLPSSHVRAARLDGARNHEVLLRVLLPEMAPTIAAVFILQFISTWNEYLWPLLIAGRMDSTTIQMGLQMFMTSEGNHYGPLMATAILAATPVILIYLFASRQITEAFKSSGRTMS
jgi:ABC-type glycerol-3-phosphate transport system permease component